MLRSSLLITLLRADRVHVRMRERLRRLGRSGAKSIMVLNEQREVEVEVVARDRLPAKVPYGMLCTRARGKSGDAPISPAEHATGTPTRMFDRRASV